MTSPIVNFLLRRTLSVTPLRNLPVKKRQEFWLNSAYHKFFICVHKNMSAPQTSDLFGEIGANFPVQLSSRSHFATIENKKVIAANINLSCWGFFFVFLSQQSNVFADERISKILDIASIVIIIIKKMILETLCRLSEYYVDFIGHFFLQNGGIYR